MNFADLATRLRDTSARFGGIADFDDAARDLDHALSRFFTDQDGNALRAVNGAVARCTRLNSTVTRPKNTERFE